MLQCSHVWFITASLTMLPQVFPVPNPLVNPPTPSHVNSSNPYSPTVCKLCYPFIHSKERHMDISRLAKSMLAAN